jgi:hypothetical protein
VHLEVVPTSIQQPTKLDMILLDLKIECSIQSGDTHVDTLATSSLETMQRQMIAGECESYRIPFIKEPFWRPLHLQAREERKAPVGVLFPLFSCSRRIGVETVCSEWQRHSSALRTRNGFVALCWHDAYHAQIGMRVNALYASTTCVLLSVWGARIRPRGFG